MLHVPWTPCVTRPRHTILVPMLSYAHVHVRNARACIVTWILQIRALVFLVYQQHTSTGSTILFFSGLTVPSNASRLITGIVLYSPRRCFCDGMMVQCNPLQQCCSSLLCCSSLSCTLERDGDGLSARDGGQKRHGRGRCRPVHSAVEVMGKISAIFIRKLCCCLFPANLIDLAAIAAGQRT